MSKDVAKRDDLNAHIQADYKTVHGIWSVVKAAIAAVYDAMWRDNTSNATTGFYVQSGLDSVPTGTDATITFDTEFAAAPRVVATPNTSTQQFTVWVHTVSTTGFKMLGYNETSGGNVDCSWIAVGRIAR
jgi:hypothetical protein